MVNFGVILHHIRWRVGSVAHLAIDAPSEVVFAVNDHDADFGVFAGAR